MIDTRWFRRRASIFRTSELTLVLCAACRSTGIAPGAGTYSDPASESVASPIAKASIPSKDEPVAARSAAPLAFDVPAGWRIDCRAAWCSSELLRYFENEEDVRDLNESVIVHPVDRASFDCFAGSEHSTPEACVFEGDFDGDHHLDRLTWILEESTLRFDMLVRWSRTGTSSIVGLGPWGHINPARGRRACAESSFEVAEWAWQATRPGDAAVRRLKVTDGQPPCDVLVLDTGGPRWIWFQDGHWRTAHPGGDNHLPPQFSRIDHGWSGGDAPVANASACTEARRIRRSAHRDRSAQRILWTKAKDVARDPCTSMLDLDGDGSKERVSWVVHRGQTGLRIDWPGGSVSVLGAGRAVPIDVLEGEPGCNSAIPSFDEIWNVEVAPWTGSEWRLPKGGRQVPFDATRVKGDALALTNMAGHVDLVFLVDGELRLSAVPFPWHEVRVLMPLRKEWTPVWPPVEEMRRYVRPRPITRERVQVEGSDSEDLPKRGRFFAGL